MSNSTQSRRKLAVVTGLVLGVAFLVAVGAGSASAVEWNETVGVVDDQGEYGDEVKSMLEGELPAYYDVEVVDSSHPRNSFPHDVYVVQHMDDDHRSSFVNYTNRSDIGAVYLERDDGGSNGIRQLAEETGDPSSVASTSYNANVSYVVNNTHPILDFPEGQTVTIQTAPLPWPAIPWFESNSTDLIASVQVNGQVFGEGLAVDENRNVVLASGLGVSEWVTPENFTQEGTEILGNAVQYTNHDPGFSIGVVDDAGQHGDAVAGAIERELGPVADVQTVHGTHPTTVSPHDVYVVQNLSAANRSQFLSGASDYDIGVVYLDQYGPESNGIEQVTGSFLVNSSTEGVTTDTPISYTVDQTHPVLEDWSLGETIQLTSGGEYTTFENATGDSIASVRNGSEVLGPGLAVHDGLNHVLAGSLGRTDTVTNASFTSDADQILGNAINHTASHPPDVHVQLDYAPNAAYMGEDIDIESTIYNNENRSYEFAVTLRANGTVTNETVVTVPALGTYSLTQNMIVGVTQPENTTVEVALPHRSDSTTVSVPHGDFYGWDTDISLANESVPNGSTTRVTATAGNPLSTNTLDVTNDTDVWSSNTSVATVDNGTVQTHAVGKATLFVELFDEMATTTLTVREPRIDQFLGVGSPPLYVNNTEPIIALVGFDNGDTGTTSEGFTATSNNTSVLEIVNGTNIQAIAPGRTDVTITTIHDNNLSITTSMDVSYPDVTDLAVDLENDTGLAGETTTATITAWWADGDVAEVTENATISSFDESVAAPDGDQVEFRNPGSTSIYAEFRGEYERRNDLDPVWNTTDVTVVEENVTGLNLTIPSTLSVGNWGYVSVTAEHYGGATEDVSGVADVSSSNTSVATVTNGTVEAHAEGTTTITATHQNVTADTTLTVDPLTALDGVITNTSGDGIDSAMVTFGNSTMTTDPDGSFSVVMTPGTYTVTASHPDYETNATTVTIPQGEVTSVSLSLEWTGTDPPTYNMTIPNDGEIHSIGFPAAAAGTLADAFPEGYDGLNNVYQYDNGWTQVTDFENTTVNPRDAYVLNTDGEGPSEISLAVPLETGTAPTTRSVGPGWSYIAAPAFTDAESSFGGSVDGSVTVLDRYGSPTSPEFQSVPPFAAYQIGSYQWGVTPPSVTPFKGYFVYFDESADLPVVVSELESKADADFQLGVTTSD